MIHCCVNPGCGAEFKFLSIGCLYALERRDADTAFYWLCPACASRFDLQLDRDGGVTVVLQSEVNHTSPPHPDGYLRLVTRRHLPWRWTTPFGERASSFGFGLARLEAAAGEEDRKPPRSVAAGKPRRWSHNVA